MSVPRKNKPVYTHERKLYIWRHNAFIGQVLMMRANLNSIIASPSTTTETKHYASSILGLIPKLQNSLVARVDPEEPK